jgi:formiminoglutamase
MSANGNASRNVGDDPLWPRVSELFTSDSSARIAIIGVPAHETSISPTHAHTTPREVRLALAKYSTYSWTHDLDLTQLRIYDAPDVESPDHAEGEERVFAAMQPLRDKTVIALGGDNSITYSVAQGLWGERIAQAGLVTVDAHHDLRDGVSNGSPVKRLIDAGLQGKNIAQIGIADFSNSPAYARRARDYQILVIPRDQVRVDNLQEIVHKALAQAGADGGPIHVDIDVDVCDRAVVPACPAAAPGGLSAYELRKLVYLFGADPRVGSIDFTEVDAQADSADARTIRLVAVCIAEFLAGVQSR